jgi:hypothetical protein
MTKLANVTAERFASLEPGESTVLSDASHRGVTVVRRIGRRGYFVADHENGEAKEYDRLRLVESGLDGDDSGLNQLCVGCDLDGRYGLWLIPGDDELDSGDGEIEVVWDSEN